MKLIFAEDAKRIVENSVGWPSNKYVICEQIDALPEVEPIPVVRRTWHEPTHDREFAGIIEKAEKVKAVMATWFQKERKSYLLYCGCCGAIMDGEET